MGVLVLNHDVRDQARRRVLKPPAHDVFQAVLAGEKPPEFALQVGMNWGADLDVQGSMLSSRRMWRSPRPRRSFRSLTLALCAAAALASSGCVSKPTMQLHHAEIRSAGPAGIGMVIFLKVHNDNSFDVEVRNVRVNVVLAGRHHLPPLAYSPNQWLPAGKTTLVAAPMIIPWIMVPPLLAETAASPNISYRCTGSADVTAIRSVGIKSDNQPVDETGSVPRMAIVDAARYAPLPLPFFPR